MADEVLRAEIKLDSSDFVAGAKKAQGATDNLSGKTGGKGMKGMTGLLNPATIAIGAATVAVAAIGAAMVSSIQASLAFNESFADLAGLGTTGEALALVKDVALEAAAQTGKGLDDLKDASFAYQSLTGDIANSGENIISAAKAGAAGMATSEQAVRFAQESDCGIQP